MKSGIYKIENSVNGKFYIGSAKNLETRWNLHLHQLRKGCHHSKHLQRAYKLYGERNFKFEVLEHVEENKLIEREQIFLDELKPFCKDIGYNISPTANSSKGIKRNEEFKKKVSESRIGDKNWRKGIKLSPATLEKCRIAKVGRKNPMFGKHHSTETKEKLKLALSGEKSPHFGKRYALAYAAKAVFQIDRKTGKIIKEWSCIKEAADYFGTKGCHISGCCRGKRKSANGHVWRYV